VFIRFMRLCNNGENSPSVVLVITIIKRRGWGGGGRCIFSLQLSYAGFQLIVYLSLMSIVNER